MKKALSLRNPRSVANALRRLLDSLKLRPKPQDTERPHNLRIHLPNLDIRARSIHPKSDPPAARTEHLGIAALASDAFFFDPLPVSLNGRGLGRVIAAILKTKKS
jgi:hypothetical protein